MLTSALTGGTAGSLIIILGGILFYPDEEKVPPLVHTVAMLAFGDIVPNKHPKAIRTIVSGDSNLEKIAPHQYQFDKQLLYKDVGAVDGTLVRTHFDLQFKAIVKSECIRQCWSYASYKILHYNLSQDIDIEPVL